MKMRSPTETPIYVALTSGHTCVIGPEFIEVEPRFHRLAVAEGAVPEGTERSVTVNPQAEATREELIVEAVKKMMDRNEPGDFTNDGRPNANNLSALVGFSVTSAQRDAAWAKVADAEA